MKKIFLLLPAIALLASCNSTSTSTAQNGNTQNNAPQTSLNDRWNVPLDDTMRQVITYTNELRTKGTLDGDSSVRTGTCAANWTAMKAVTPSGVLTQIANDHGLYIANVGWETADPHGEAQTSSRYFTGATPLKRLERAYSDKFYGSIGENVAEGFPDPKAVVYAWLHSSGHCANLMNPDWKYLGTAHLPIVAPQPDNVTGIVWVQDFSTN